jgi:hypothetical protein
MVRVLVGVIRAGEVQGAPEHVLKAAARDTYVRSWHRCKMNESTAAIRFTGWLKLKELRRNCGKEYSRQTRRYSRN